MIDFIQNSEGKIDISQSDGQHINDLLVLYKGHNKPHPMVGVGVHRFMHDEEYNFAFHRQSIINELQQDGAEVAKVQFVINQNDEIKVQINADYPS